MPTQKYNTVDDSPLILPEKNSSRRVWPDEPVLIVNLERDKAGHLRAVPFVVTATRAERLEGVREC